MWAQMQVHIMAGADPLELEFTGHYELPDVGVGNCPWLLRKSSRCF